MSKIGSYKESLDRVGDIDAYLLKESGLPGPRGNIELGQAVADWGNEKLFEHLLSFTPDKAPVNSPYEFLAFCGTVGMGRLLADGDVKKFKVIRELASDPRWRVREGVAMALQRLGMKDMGRLLDEMEKWSKGNPLEQRAAAAALCEPALLKDKKLVLRVLKILDNITASMGNAEDRRSDEFVALKKGMGYCWSVAAAASPEDGKKAMEKWFSSKDKDIIRVMQENLKKNRLERKDPAWVKAWKEHFNIK
ncbi:MAG TPA: hypothetical protein VMC84_12250 [Methanocella sp.]|uniref:hypothetical protein n=1 Tax=Methanocella sp. TaxID=2052833 RepID=UPI002CB9D1E8|nr:hypothetical protein [Methanocella sp.]HTY91938.1 hypothetical protein [Methanocella sp.]